MSSDSEERVPSRKRSRTSEEGRGGSGAKEGKKARGRPRVDTQDATAADRRRTQIRLAQRAYRQRKETTIVSLKQQSEQLHSIIEQMNKTFLRFSDSVQKSGLLQLNQTLAQELKHATEIFNSLSKTASEFEAGDEEHPDVVEHAADAGATRQSQATAPLAIRNVDIGWGYSAMPDHSEPTSREPPTQTQTQPENYYQNLQEPFSDSLVRREPATTEFYDQMRKESQRHQTAASSQPTQELPFGLIDLLHQNHTPYGNRTPQPHIYSVNVPIPDVTPSTTRLSIPPFPIPNSVIGKTPSPAFTYSHDEVTFARRLTRAALETAFHLLSTAGAPPASLSYVFKLSLPYYNYDGLRTRFKVMLSRSVDEDIDAWDIPFILLGGAGTHYPRKDANGNLVPTKNVWTIRQIGPPENRIARLESPDGQWQELSDIDLGAYEGEWYDSYDVQGYLEEKWNCRLNPKSSFAECMVEEEELPEPPNLGFLLDQLDANAKRSPHDSDSPGLTHSSTNSPSASSTSNSNTNSTDPYNFSDQPFGLDMSFQAPPYPHGSHHFSKMDEIDMSIDQTLGLDLAPGFDFGFPGHGGFGGMNLGLDMMGPPPHVLPAPPEVLPVVKQKKKRAGLVQLNILIDEMIKHGICLGRGPGFRRRDIDNAMRKALIPAC